jgi:uncharacterized protein
MNDIERRTMAVQLRVDNKGGSPVITGTAAVFNSLSEDLGGFREQIAPGAFRSAIMDGCDVRALFNHEPSMILGRTTAKTLRLLEIDAGLFFEVDMPDTTYAKDLMASLRRGDINQCSFGFRVDDGGDVWQKDGAGMWTRTINVVSRLYDVSPVTFPAYAQTDCALRSLEKVRAELPPFDDTELRRLKLELTI